MKDTSFYNRESAQYSSKRYPAVPRSYTQFFFKRRLSIAKKFVAKIIALEKRELSLLEVGCADGVVLRELGISFPRAFSKLVGIDTSPAMIEEARRRAAPPRAEFLLRGEYAGYPPVDVINETGVINYAGFDPDLQFAYDNTAAGGWYVLSVAGTNSLLNRLKGEAGFSDFRSYQEYEKLLRERFSVMQVEGCGLFIPHIWKFHPLARAAQPLAEAFFGRLFPSLCHEKIYLLRRR
jgi:SAM-dependent methyltransferase